jgi:hypothetical protein
MKVARPGRLELPTLCLEATQYKTLSAASVAYGTLRPFTLLLNRTEVGLT